MVPPDSDRVSPAPPYSGYHQIILCLRLRDYHPLRCRFPTVFDFAQLLFMWSYNPAAALTTTVWALPSSLATTTGITIVFSSSRYLDVSVPWVDFSFEIIGLPHSEITGSWSACLYPVLIAACHVLHRLQMPRHPPCILLFFLPKNCSSKIVLISVLLYHR